MSAEPEPFNLSDLPDWAREALAVSPPAEEPPAKSVLDHQGGPAWKLLLDAAVVTSFLPRELGPSQPDLPERSASEKAVLSFAEPTQDPKGIRWALTREARRAILGAAITSGEAAAAASRTAAGFPDPVSRALRDCVTKRAVQPFDSVDLQSLEAARVAVSWLTGLRGLNLPSLEDLDREIELRRLLAQFERMVGQAPGPGGTSRPDRFFGRKQEIEDLREYVGVIPADSFLTLAARVVKRTARGIKGRTPMCIWGTGGVGKTTLIAKFMLEHARAAASRYPFAYLDFDRTTVSARDRAGLLAEMCLQVGAQFSELTEPMAHLREGVQELGRKMAASPDGDSVSFLLRYAYDFRDLVDRHLDQLESAFEWARPFLLVFDTFEVVQYTPADVTGLEDFIRLFSRGGERAGMWPRLRLILSGRKEVSEFLGKIEERDRLQLGPLDPDGSAEMLVALAGDAGKPIPQTAAKDLVKAIAKRVGEDPRKGVRPLRLRLVGEVFRQMADADGLAVVRSLLEDLSQPTTKDGLTGRLFVDGILVRRILGHVSDPRVRRLADPGLVVRRITPDVIREVMARGTPRPDGTDQDPGDPETIEPWIIDKVEAESIFKAFKSEVRLVEIDGDSLRHRQDVRQEMLPLIRARRPKRFQALHQLAFDFFRTRAEADPKDLASAAEAVYHGLWLQQPLPLLDRLWRGGPSFAPRIDPDEFEAGTPANIYVRAKAKDRLKPQEISILPRETALEWLAARKDDLLSERRLDESVVAIRAVVGDDYAALDNAVDVAAVVARLLYRCGLWREARELIGRHVGPQTVGELISLGEGLRSGGEVEARSASLFSLVRIWATLAGKAGAPPEELLAIVPAAEYPISRDPTVQVEMLAYLALGVRQAGGGHPAIPDLSRWIDGAASRVSADQWSRTVRVLRLAILTGSENVRELLEIYLGSMERPPCDPELVPLVHRVFSEVLKPEDQSVIRKLLPERTESQEASNQVDRLWRGALPELQQAARKSKDLTAALWTLVAFQHFDWINPFGNALARALAVDKKDVILTHLDERDLLRPWPPRSGASQRRPDGHTIVRWAVDRGRFLHLANALPELAPLFPEPPASGPARIYPQRVFGIADALLRWHHTIVSARRMPVPG